jgi:hypothetical protein
MFISLCDYKVIITRTYFLTNLCQYHEIKYLFDISLQHDALYKLLWFVLEIVLVPKLCGRFAESGKFTSNCLTHSLTNQPTNQLPTHPTNQQSNLHRAKSFTRCQQLLNYSRISQHLWNLKLHYCVNKSTPLDLYPEPGESSLCPPILFL